MNINQLFGLEAHQIIAQLQTAFVQGLHEITLGQAVVRLPQVTHVATHPFELR